MMGLELVHTAASIDAKTLRYVGVAQHGAQSLLRMVTDILDVNQADAGRLALDLAMSSAEKIIKLACQQTEVMAYEAGVMVMQDVDDHLPPICVDAEKLRRVLVNLISNAVQHTPHAGTVKISGRRTQDGRTLVLQIKDTGVGMPTESFTQIFEKFGRVHGRKIGGRVSTGLGLPFCKKAIEAHGGTISVSSELGHGTVFHLEIPYDVSARP